MIFQQPVEPFPDPTHAGQEIEFIGLMFGVFLLFIILICLMLYMSKKMSKDIISIIVIYMCSLMLGIQSISMEFFPLVFIWFQLFFLLFQSSLFFSNILAYYNYKKGVL